MAKVINKPKVISTPKPSVSLSRGVYSAERTPKFLSDGEVFFDTTGAGIWMGVYQGPDKPIKVVEISSGAGSSGTISPEQLSSLLSTSDVRKDAETGIVYIGKAGSEVAVASTDLTSSLRADLSTTQATVSTLNTQVAANTNAIAILQSLTNNQLSEEAKAYINQLLSESNLSSDESTVVTIETLSTEKVILDVATDTTSIGKLESETGQTTIGTVWADNEDAPASSSSNGEPDGTDNGDELGSLDGGGIDASSISW